MIINGTGEPRRTTLEGNRGEMKTMFKNESGDWKDCRAKFNLSPEDELDLHFGRRDKSIPYEDVMAKIVSIIEELLRKAQKNGRQNVLILHGSSTSGSGKVTARSQVRSFMRSKQATPLILRRHCEQRDTVFLVKIRLQKSGLGVRSEPERVEHT
jgi:hypothetical protein